MPNRPNVVPPMVTVELAATASASPPNVASAPTPPICSAKPSAQKPSMPIAVDDEVHAHRVRDVLRAREAGLDQREAGLHEHHEEAGDQRPDDVERGLSAQHQLLRVGDLFGQLGDAWFGHQFPLVGQNTGRPPVKAGFRNCGDCVASSPPRALWGALPYQSPSRRWMLASMRLAMRRMRLRTSSALALRRRCSARSVATASSTRARSIQRAAVARCTPCRAPIWSMLRSSTLCWRSSRRSSGANRADPLLERRPKLGSQLAADDLALRVDLRQHRLEQARVVDRLAPASLAEHAHGLAHGDDAQPRAQLAASAIGQQARSLAHQHLHAQALQDLVEHRRHRRRARRSRGGSPPAPPRSPRARRDRAPCTRARGEGRRRRRRRITAGSGAPSRAATQAMKRSGTTGRPGQACARETRSASAASSSADGRRTWPVLTQHGGKVSQV